MKYTYLLLIAFVFSCKNNHDNNKWQSYNNGLMLKTNDSLGLDTIFLGRTETIHDTIYIYDTVYTQIKKFWILRKPKKIKWFDESGNEIKLTNQ